MPIEPLPKTSPHEAVNPADSTEVGADAESPDSERPLELSDFSQRLASFGLGEAPDPLLTEARPPVERRSRT